MDNRIKDAKEKSRIKNGKRIVSLYMKQDFKALTDIIGEEIVSENCYIPNKLDFDDFLQFAFDRYNNYCFIKNSMVAIRMIANTVDYILSGYIRSNLNGEIDSVYIENVSKHMETVLMINFGCSVSSTMQWSNNAFIEMQMSGLHAITSVQRTASRAML